MSWKPVLIGASLMALPAGASACATAHGNWSNVMLTSEQAVIMWDPVTRMEHFIRRAEFDSNAKDYGFIVPVPNVPTIKEVSDSPFDWLFKLLPAPRGGFAKPAGGAGSQAGAVTVHSVQRIGDYEVAVLSGTKAVAVTNWIKDNGYSNRSALTDWIDHYVQKKWKFAAFKFLNKEKGLASTKAIRISFKTAYPYYPYKAPKDDWPENKFKPMFVYFVSDTEYDARFLHSRTPWDAMKTLTGRFTSQQYQYLVDSFGIAETPQSTGKSLTVFQNTHNSGDYSEDLEFYVNTQGKKLVQIPNSVPITPHKTLQQSSGLSVGG